MGLSSAIDWWDEWKLRILVLCSLSVHFFLFFSGYVRQWYVLRWLRVIVWIAYIGGDALAVYALATLFNRHKQQQAPAATGGGGGSALEVTWAPVLLIHLGGQILITAYSLEDNELWKRHAVTLVSQVTVALYVFCQWWSGETRLMLAAVLLFIVGILKCGQKPWALRRASYGSMASTNLSSSSRSPPPRAEEEEESSSRWRLFGKFCTALCTNMFCFESFEILKKPRGGGLVEKQETIYSLEEYIKEAHEHVKQGPKASGKSQREKFDEDDSLFWKDVHKMFLDLSAPHSVRLHYLSSFLNLDGQNQHTVLREWIGMQFLAIYTRMRSTLTCLGFSSILVVPGLVLASVVLFAKSDKDGYHKSDITVTYILFCGTLVIELAPFFIAFVCKCVPRCNQPGKLRWQDMVAQHNIVSFCARKKQPPTLIKLAATFSYLRHYINKHWYIRHELAAKQISMLVRHHAEEDGWKEYIRDAATYTRFNNLRGEHTLMKMKHKHHLLLLEQGKLGWTFNLPYDEYVLLWHIATDLCIHHPSSEPQHNNPIIPSRHNSVIISNYMIYLLFICPEMLIPGARSDLFILACDDIEHIIKNQPLPSLDERSIAQRVLRMGQDGDERMKESRMISDAYRLARVLIDLHNDTMWEMIQGVWVEMLCYSASKSRGYQHAKSLAYGGEFLTNVWLLWWCMGMQTLPDMLNHLGPPEEQTAAAAASV